MSGAGKHVMKRIPLIKFPVRHPKPSGSTPPPHVTTTTTGASKTTTTTGASKTFFSKSESPASLGGKASLQPKRTPVSEKEIEAVILGGCI